MFHDPANFLRLALTLSLSVYIEPEARAEGYSPFTLSPLFEERQQDVPLRLEAWGEKVNDYPWVRSLQLIGTLLTQKGIDAVPDVKCQLFYHANRKMIILSFRGTETMENAITDLRYFQQELDSQVYPLLPSVMAADSKPVVHSGFQAAYLAIRERVLVALRNALVTHRVDDLLCVGHSLGGALASLAALDLSLNKENFRLPKVPSLVTFGCPHVGNQAFADISLSKVPQSVRIANKQDPVTHILEQAQTSAAWLKHSHEPFVHSATQAIVLQASAAQAFSDIFSPPANSSRLSALTTLLLDQHKGLGYLQALETHLQNQEAAGKPVLQDGEDPNAALKAVASLAGNWLLGSLRSALASDPQTAPTSSPGSTSTTVVTASSTTTTATTPTESSTTTLFSTFSRFTSRMGSSAEETKPSTGSSK